MTASDPRKTGLSRNMQLEIGGRVARGASCLKAEADRYGVTPGTVKRWSEQYVAELERRIGELSTLRGAAS